ncbi:MAG: LytTR family DNA-binding domain-containing protein [Bacteroidales bacterium]|nr:LytTR family DNA-binding domain-containing protein [Bacteroidales bacterium]
MKNNTLITSFVVDDDSNSVRLLSDMLTKTEGFDLIGTAGNYEDAVNAILNHKPDLLLLDIMMPHKGGFEIMKEIRRYDYNPRIVFVTAYDRYAIEAFHEAAFNYLLKPVSRADLTHLLERIKHENHQLKIKDKIDSLMSAYRSKKIPFNTRTGFIMINPSNVVFIKASGNYSEIYCHPPDKLVVTYYLSEVEKKLPKDLFFRISRSVIINLNYLFEVNRKERYCEINWQDQLFRFHMPLNYIRSLETII